MKIAESTFSELPSELIGSVTEQLGLLFYLPHIDDVNQLLPKIIKTTKRKLNDWDSPEYDSNLRRAVKMLRRIVTSKELAEGKLLVSIFCDTYCQRGRQIHTRAINDISTPEFSEAPENLDYNMDTLMRRLSDEQKKALLTEEGIQRESVVLRQHQTRANQPFVKCDTCHGSGEQRCPACGGSGREQYVDGYYASGEKRIKTGACTTCQGRGRVACSDCQGDGRIEIFAPNYTLEKSVTETWTQNVYGAFVSPLVGEYHLRWMDSHTSDDRRNRMQEAVFDDDCVWLKMKNRKEMLENNSEAYMGELERLGMLDAYQATRELVKEEARKSGIVCIQERHYIIPVTRIRINTHRLFDEASDDQPFDIYILPRNKEEDAVIVNRNFKGMSKAERFFTWLFKRRKQWANVKTSYN